MATHDHEILRYRRGQRVVHAVLASSFLVLLLTGYFVFGIDDSSQMPPLAADEIAVMTSEDELELFEELEFYLWLEDEENV